MKQWWQTLSRREQILVMVMAGLVGILFFILFVIRPLNKFQSNAKAALAAAQIDYKLVQQAQGEPSDQKGLQGSALRAAVTAGARQNNIRLATIRLDDQGTTIFVSTDGTSWEQLTRWLIELQQQSAIEIIEGDIRKRGSSDTISAQLTLQAR
ncbi:MAG: type II secretion system protein GspM [bacterium]